MGIEKEDRTTRHAGAYYNAETLDALSDALSEARRLLSGEGSPESSQALQRIKDAEEMLMMPRRAMVQLGPTEDLRSDRTRNLLLDIVRLATDSEVDLISMDQVKISLNMRGTSIGSMIDELVSKGYLIRENRGTKRSERFIQLTDKTKSLMNILSETPNTQELV